MSIINTQLNKSNSELQSKLISLVGDLQKEPEKANLKFAAKSTLKNGFKADVTTRDFKFVSDEPHSLGGTDKGPNPVEYVLGALAACQEIVVKAHATALGVNVTEVQVDVEGDLDLNGLLNLTKARPGFNQVTFKTTIKTDETDEEKRKLIEELTLNNCPVLDTIQNPVSVNAEVTFDNN